MKLLGCILLIVIISTAFASVSSENVDLNFGKGKNGGLGCVACTALVGIVEQLTEFKNNSVVSTLDQLCKVLPPKFAPMCKYAVDFLGPSLVKLIIHKNGPDVICHALNFCFTEPGLPTCTTIVPPWESTNIPFELRVAKAKALIRPLWKQNPDDMEICDVPGIKFLCEFLNRTLETKSPLVDFDKDGFSTSTAYRGTTWRGKDCSDVIANVHPGAIPMDHDRYFDSNCNGIYGVNNVTKQAYEDEYCTSSRAKGVAVIGDSIGAHFSLPANWLDATEISLEGFKHLALIIQDEFDWPMLGSFTGHGTNEWKEAIQGPIDSIYNRMIERNHCNHRDYQNIAVNGGDSFNVHKAMKRLSRDRTLDQPLLLFVILIGNDVCQGKSQNLSKMTTPEEMYTNTLETLDYLNQHIPAGSSVVIEGLADGRVLYESMANRIHPIGHYWNELTYSQFYEYLNCLGSSPCPAWLNSNATIRDNSAKRVIELNNALKDLVSKRKNHYSNFDLHYLEDPVKTVLDDWAKKGGESWQLVELADGFHSNQLAQSLTSQVIWKDITTNMPEILGPINPHNEEIKKRFGDQGGY